MKEGVNDKGGGGGGTELWSGGEREGKDGGKDS